MTAPPYCVRCGGVHHMRAYCGRDWPVKHPYPNGTPTDAELQAERDQLHAEAVADWLRRNPDPVTP